VVRKTGSFFSYGEQRLGQGRENAKDFLRRNPEITSQIEREIRERALAAKNPQPPVEEGSNGVPTEADLEEVL
jgi:recombination protein RecA